MADQPQIKLANGQVYRTAGAWDDLQEAIINAKHMIYITGAILPQIVGLPQQNL